MDEALLADHVEALYATDRSNFVAERNRRVKQLRADGHREEATALARRRKPTLAAWAVDQAVRRDEELVDELLDAAGALHDAQQQATSGGRAGELRPATQQVHRLVDGLTDLADGVLDDAGAGGHHDEVRQTLLAAALDPAMHDDLRRGVIERAAEHVGFGGLVGTGIAPRDDEAAAEAARIRSRRRELEQHRAALRRSLDEERTRADRARVRADELRQRADRAEADAIEAAEVSDRVAEELDHVEAELDELAGR